MKEFLYFIIYIILFTASIFIKTLDKSSREKAFYRKAEDSLIITVTLESEETITVICVKVKLNLL